MPVWRVTSTETTVTARVTDDEGFSYFNYSLRNASNTIIDGPTGYTTSKSKTFTGLDPSTDYIVCLNWSTSTTGMGNIDYLDIRTQDEAIVTVDPWSWTSSNGSATATQTRNALRACQKTSGYYVSDFSYKVWNDMVDKVVEAWHADGGYFNTRYLSYDETCMTSSDRVLTADRFNSLRYNIGVNYSTGINDVYPGDPVLGSYFITMANSLNSWIARI